jgi:hypothetical protein
MIFVLRKLAAGTASFRIKTISHLGQSDHLKEGGLFIALPIKFLAMNASISIGLALTLRPILTHGISPSIMSR